MTDIFRVGLPASAQQLSMSFTMLMINLILVPVAGTDGVAIYTTGWRVVTVATLPLLGIATAVVSVTGASFGQGDLKKLNTAFVYALKIGIVIEIFLATATFLFSPQITAIFTRAKGALRIADDLVFFLKIICLFYPATAFGMFSSSMFQGVGKGINALILTIIRTIILTLLFSVLFTFTLDMGLAGVWFGILVGNTLGGIISFFWAKKYINSLILATITSPNVESSLF